MGVLAQGSVDVSLAGESVVLLPGKALFWPSESTLFVADLHLGKAAAFRALAVPVPTGATQDTLCRLSALLDETEASRVCLLGDLWHAQAGRTEGALSQFLDWRARHSGVSILFVEGNHDRKCLPLSSDLGIETVDRAHAVGPFRLLHEPEDLSDGGYALAGHLHPGARLEGRGDQLTLPCFWFGASCGVLPAFGSFTGFGRIRPISGDRVYVVASSCVVPV